MAIRKNMQTSAINTKGCLMHILNYRIAKSIDVIFEDGTIVCNKDYHAFLNGKIFNPNLKSLYGIGYIGIGEYKPYDYSDKKDKQYSKMYILWNGMFDRCYNEKIKSYNECTVDNSFHCFQDFAKWYVENKWTDEINLQVDKDILIKGNKIYSSNTCSLVPQDINKLFVKDRNRRNELPIGVSKIKNSLKYRARYRNNNVEINLGSYVSVEDAFNAYKITKENHIKQVADEYKAKYPNFPQKLYDAMYSYEVEITD